MPMPSKGDREYIPARVPRALAEQVRARATELGYGSTNDYVNAVLAVHEGMPELAPKPRPGAPQGDLFEQEGGGRLRRSA